MVFESQACWAGCNRIRAVAAHDICARVEYAKTPVAQAAKDVFMEVIPKLGGDGGVIALDANGNFAMPFNTDGMCRGWVDREGKVHVAIVGKQLADPRHRGC